MSKIKIPNNLVANLPSYFHFNGILYRIENEKVSVVSSDEKHPLVSLGLVSTEDLEHRINYLQGRVLTVIDASVVDKDQKKAIKDLIKQIMSEEHNRLSDSATGFHTLSEGDMVQYGGSVEEFYENQVEPALVKA